MTLRNQATSLWQRLMRHGERNRLPVSEGNGVRPLWTGGQILESVRTLMQKAGSTIHFEIYGWSDDETGRDLLECLRQAQVRGVRVRGVVDHVGSWDAVGMIEAAGLGIRFYHPIGWRLPWRLWHRRNHRKLVIVDGARAVVGSANWADDYNCEFEGNCYRDLGLELQGPVVEHLEADFRKSWGRAGGRALEAVRGALPPEAGLGWYSGIPIQVVSSLNGGGRALRRHLLLTLRQLRRRAVIANAYFIPDPQFLRTILRTVRRGVKVDLLVPGNSDHRFVQAASRATFGRLLRAGARIWELRERMLHAKAAVLDDDLVVLGSANLDSRSFRHNLELNLVLRSEDLALAIQNVLEADRAESEPWSGEALPAWKRALQRFAYLFWWWL